MSEYIRASRIQYTRKGVQVISVRNGSAKKYPDDYHNADEKLEREGLKQLFNEEEIDNILVERNRRNVNGSSDREDDGGDSDGIKSQRRKYTLRS